MTDRLFIRDLLVRCYVGLSDEELRERQDVLISLVIYVDLTQAARSDRVEDSVNYRDVKKRILDLAESSRVHLVETLATRVAEICLEQPLVQRVRVTVEKPTALRFARSVGVTIVRERESG
ncbi:MAG: dihydroneopterin aldolase [Polyangiaceae bacterium]|nr:dihydroneopterin aldolase [Polyangiaceae bacterium]